MILFTFSPKILAYELKETYNDFVKVIYNVLNTLERSNKWKEQLKC